MPQRPLPLGFIRTMIAGGSTVPEIAASLGVNAKSVWRVCRSNGIALPEKPMSQRLQRKLDKLNAIVVPHSPKPSDPWEFVQFEDDPRALKDNSYGGLPYRPCAALGGGSMAMVLA